MPNTTMVFIPQNGTNVIQAGQIIPGTVIQPPGVIQYVGHQFGSPSNQLQQNHQMGPWEKLIKAETKTLGAIQIIIGLIHIGFGGVQTVLAFRYYLPLATVGGYPFWGGLFFIVSGSLSVSSEKNPCVMKCSVGFNIVSAVMAFIGVILYITELAVNKSYTGFYTVPVGTGLAVLLLLFTLLEFFITVSTAHFGCQTCCCKNNPDMVFVPYMVTGVGAVPAEGSPSPPSYDNIAFTPNSPDEFWCTGRLAEKKYIKPQKRAMATDPVRTANGIMLFIPANENNTIQPGQRIPGTMIQPPGMAQYVDQLFGRPRNQPKQQHWVMVHAKTLGAIQIFFGLIHVCFGGVSVALLFRNYFLMFTSGGYQFWAGLFFIASGSLSVSAAKHFNSNLTNCSLGMNITSAVIASIGIILCLIELGLKLYLYSYAYYYQWDNLMSAGVGIGVLLLLFSILEFSITVSVVHFGCQATCCSPDTRIDALPCTVAEDCVTLLEASPAPGYNPADFSPNTVV